MNNSFFVIAVSAFLLLATMFLGSVAFADDGTVNVRGVYINGGNGMQFFLDSTVNDTVCVFPTVATQQNAYGSLGGDKFQLGPNEQGVNIGEFNRASSDAWYVRVTETWNAGECADQ